MAIVKQIFNPTLALFVFTISCFYLSISLFYFNIIPLYLSSIINTVMIYMMYTVMHESVHRNIHKTKWINNLLGRICAFHEGITFPIYKISHMQHHRYPNDLHKDPDGILGKKPQFLLPIWLLIRLLHDNSFMIKNKLWRKKKDLIEHVITLIFQGAAIILLSYIFSLSSALFLWIIPLAISGALIELSVAWLVHFPHDAKQPLQHTRLLKSKVLQFLMLNHNFHLVHHIWPRIPWYLYGEKVAEAEKLQRKKRHDK